MQKARTGSAIVGALLALLSGCDGTDVEPSQAAGGSDCEEQHRSTDAMPYDRDRNESSWAAAALSYGQDDDGSTWEPPAGTATYAVGEEFVLANWTIEVVEIDYDATEEVLSSLGERGMSYERTPIDGRTWVVAEVQLTNDGTEVASPDAGLETRYISRDGTGLYIDFQCGMDNPDSEEVDPSQTTTVYFGIPVQPEHVDGGFWGIGLAEAVGEPDVSDVEHLAYVPYDRPTGEPE